MLKLILLFVALLAMLLVPTDGQQNLMHLSYPDGYQPRPPITPSTTTTTTTLAPDVTTKKTGFFGRIGNFFSGGSKTTTEVPTSSTTTPTTPRSTTSTTQSSTTRSTTSAAPRITERTTQKKEEFPALPSRASTPSQPTPSTPPSAWKNPPSTVPSVQFLPRQTPQPPVPIFTTKVTSTTPVAEGSIESEVLSLSETLFTKDSNNAARYVTPNYASKTVSYSTQDDAPNPFLAINNEASLNAIPTVSKMKLLFNNYELDSSVNEHSTALEKNEESDFLDAVLGTAPMRAAMLFLQRKDKVTADPASHKDLLKTVWFSMYSRGQGRIGSSGFEHVFLAELKNNSVIGLHNWIFMHEVEKSGHLDYKGYIRKQDLGSSGSIAKIRFSYDNINKPVNSLFVGTSPELEMALYTVCFAIFPDTDCLLSGHGQKFKIKTYTFRYRGKSVIGSAYPEII
ncbi:endoribonuclease CG2145-like [Phlebotomus argentipes]|uniref:endoribonuclease CG2145-like n=1 Tax=Phlebotomus argentipes TaxID=94469 RepID=UPI002892B580|nr:endoribonuclease CG2145-like [Phlebotomus argentipes]